MTQLPEWAVSQIVERAGRGITAEDRGQIVRGVIDSAAFAFEQIRNEAMIAAAEHGRPSSVLRPKISIDGDQWCALYGENLQDGVAGFGVSPAAAFADFDRAWVENLPARGGGDR